MRIVRIDKLYHYECGRMELLTEEERIIQRLTITGHGPSRFMWYTICQCPSDQQGKVFWERTI